MTLFVSISRAIIQNNAKNGRNDPPFEIRHARDQRAPDTLHQAEFRGTVRLVYDPANPLPSQAKCWIEIEPDPPAGKVIHVHIGESADASDGL